jgi:hypothetical protein
VKADEAGAEGYALGQTGMLDAAGEGKVFDDLHAKRFVAADLKLSGSAEEVEGADTD